MMVVVHHVLNSRMAERWNLAETDFGRPGVLVFFVISGFVMMHACRDEAPATFAIRRVIRVAPLYWVMTLAFFAIVLAGDVAKGAPLQRVPDLVQSLLFIPHYHFGSPEKIWPILVPGWTLNYEMFFFVLFAIGIASGRVRIVVPAMLVALLVAGQVITTDNALIVTWTHPFLILFLAGIGLAVLWETRDFSSLTLLFPLGLGVITVAASNLLPEDWMHPAFYVGAVLTVTGTLALQSRWPDLRVGLLGTLGDASYSIYLLHTILMVFIFKALRMLPFDGPLFAAAAGVATVVICAAAGVLCYRKLEKPMLQSMRRRFDPGKRIVRGAP